MVPCTHSGCMCCEGGGGGGLLNMGLLKVFSSCFLREIEPHSGSVYTQCLKMAIVESQLALWTHGSTSNKRAYIFLTENKATRS